MIELNYEMNNLSGVHGTVAIDAMLHDALNYGIIDTYPDIVKVFVGHKNNCIVLSNDDIIKQVVFDDRYNVKDIIIL